MNRIVGLDGYKKGWVAVWIDEHDCGICFLRSIGDLLRMPFARALIDIPIGLPETGVRSCDTQARRLLGRNWPRVFTGIRRGLLQFERASYAEANAWAKSSGGGISKQLFGILPKIAQVDRFLSKERQRILRETHPELVFLRLNAGRPLAGKKTQEGLEMRRTLIRAKGLRDVDNWLDRVRFGTGAKPDDILDACAAAIAARDMRSRIPSESEFDAKGLQMEICY